MKAFFTRNHKCSRFFRRLSFGSLVILALTCSYAGSDRLTQSRKANETMIVTGDQLIKKLGGKLLAETKVDKMRGRGSFNLVDLDHDGFITRVEYVDKGKFYTKQQREDFFNGADRNWDDIMTFTEFVEHVSVIDYGTKIFRELDKNRDWNLSKKELNKKLKIKSRTLFNTCFNMLDYGGDGRISYSEYLAKWSCWARTHCDTQTL